MKTYASALLGAVVYAGSVPHYDAPTRTLTVPVDGVDRFHYTFGKGGAVNGIYDLSIMPGTNLVAKSFQGETTDRVI